MSEDPPILVFMDALAEAFGPALGRHVVLDVDGERVEGEVTGLGTQEVEPRTGSAWYVEVGGQRVSVTREDLERICRVEGEQAGD